MAIRINIEEGTIYYFSHEGVTYGKEPKIGTTKDGKKSVTFKVQCAFPKKDKDGNTKYENIEYKCKAFGYIAEKFEREYNFNPNIKTKVNIYGKIWEAVAGKIPIGEYMGNAYFQTILVESLSFVQQFDKTKAMESETPMTSPNSNAADNGITDDDIPF